MNQETATEILEKEFPRLRMEALEFLSFMETEDLTEKELRIKFKEYMEN